MIEITAEEMFLKMEEDRKAEETTANKQIILNDQQNKIYISTLNAGFIDLGIPGIPLEYDTNIVVDYLSQNHNNITSELKNNDIVKINEEGNEEVEEKPATFVIYIGEE